MIIIIINSSSSSSKNRRICHSRVVSSSWVFVHLFLGRLTFHLPVGGEFVSFMLNTRSCAVTAVVKDDALTYRTGLDDTVVAVTAG